ncbi:unnamed protein product, partial [Didymodactylos carnosus]
MDRLVPLLEQHQQTDVPPSTFKQRVSVDTDDTDILASLFNSERLSLPPVPLQSQVPLTQLILSPSLSSSTVTTIPNTTTTGVQPSPFNRTEIWVSRLPPMPNVSHA